MWFVVAAQLFNAYTQSQSEGAMADYNSSVAQANAARAEAQRKQVIQNGLDQENKLKNQARNILGQQRAGFAAQGIDISSGSAKDVQQETLDFSVQDAQTIRNNAYLESLGFETQKQNYLTGAKQQQDAVQNRKYSSLISAGLSGYGAYQGQVAKNDADAEAAKK